jgi:hypothetical protein
MKNGHLILLALIPSISFSQQLTTNWVTAAANFREVNGKLYNTENSKLFEEIFVEPESFSPKGMLAWKLKPTRSIPRASVNASQSVGAYAPASGRPLVTGFEPEYRIVIQNWPKQPEEIQLKKKIVSEQNSTARERNWALSRLEGNQMCIRAMKVNSAGGSNSILETWDCGSPHIVAVVITNNATSAANPK